jgi:hypothetical protein
MDRPAHGHSKREDTPIQEFAFRFTLADTGNTVHAGLCTKGTQEKE